MAGSTFAWLRCFSSENYYRRNLVFTTVSDFPLTAARRVLKSIKKQTRVGRRSEEAVQRRQSRAADT
jgi:hypothetical protein